ncbi:hypothetical protein Syun_010047 [Stephania yunnanensis]|uniref:Uncharacterized protein n=1 Tax=Stephania yunnanensis TaxID=152371 RepID=A0AAP0KFQ8_9MAGN
MAYSTVRHSSAADNHFYQQFRSVRSPNIFFKGVKWILIFTTSKSQPSPSLDKSLTSEHIP